MTEYEIKCKETWAWYTGYVHDYDMKEKKFFVTYPDDWKSGEWIDASSIRYKFDVVKYNLSTWIPTENEEVECKARAEEREPYGWWPCKAKPYKPNNDDDDTNDISDDDNNKLYSVSFVGWGDQHNEILGSEYIRPKSKSKLLSIRNMNKDTYSVPTELKDWMSEQSDSNNLFETLVPNKANNKLIHLKYDSSSNILTLIGTKRVLDTTKDIIYCFCEKQKTLLKLEEKTQEYERKAKLKRQREENAFKHTFNIHPLLSGYLRGKQGSNIQRLLSTDNNNNNDGGGNNQYQNQQYQIQQNEDDILHSNKILTIEPQNGSCYIAAETKESLNYAIDQLQIVAKKIIIPTSEMGQIIGSQGQQIQDIKKKSGVIKVISWYKWKEEEFQNLKYRHMKRYQSYNNYEYDENEYDENNENEENEKNKIPDLIKNATKDNIFDEENDIIDLTTGYQNEIDDQYKNNQQQNDENNEKYPQNDALVVIGRKSRVKICIFMIEMTLSHFRTITKTRNNVKLLKKKIAEIKGNPNPPSYSRSGRNSKSGGSGRNRGNRNRYNRYNQQNNEQYYNNQQNEDDDQKDGASPNSYKKRQNRGRGSRGRGGRGNRGRSRGRGRSRQYNSNRSSRGGGRNRSYNHNRGGGDNNNDYYNNGYYGNDYNNNNYHNKNEQQQSYEQDYNNDDTQQQQQEYNDNTEQQQQKSSNNHNNDNNNKNDENQNQNQKRRRNRRKRGKGGNTVQQSS